MRTKKSRDWELFWHTVIYGTVVAGVFFAIVTL